MTDAVPSLDRSAPRAETPVAAQYLATFLKPEMLHIYRQICALREFRPVVLCQKREHADTFPFDDLRILPKARTHALRRIWQKQILGRPITIYRSEALWMLRVLQNIEASLLHVYFGHMGVHLLPLLEISPLPIIVSFHGADAGVDLEKPAHQVLTRRMLKKAALLLVRSESLAQKLVAFGTAKEKIKLHRTGIPLGEIAFQQRHAPPDGAWRCVQACRLIPKKGLATTLQAFARFAAEYPQATLTIAGDGPQLPELRALAASLGIAQSVEFCGFLPQATLRELYARSHFFLHPSEISPDGDQEGVPNSMLEAMASGLVVAATLHGGIPEAVENGVSGWLVPERDDEALSQALKTLAGDPQRYAQMSAAGAARVSTHFDLANQTRILEGLYREAIASSSLPAEELAK
jgi:colanic acid/amylovoran biosynthesis glycosyltransferase